MNTLIVRVVSASSQLVMAAALLCCAGLTYAAETGPASEPKGHQMRRYQAFARQADLPAMTATTGTLLSVGSNLTIDAARLATLSAAQMDALAGQFHVPATVIANVLQRHVAFSVTQLAQELKTAVVDYRFLQGEWGRYHPPQAGQPLRTEALEALQSGDIAKAWSLYDNLGLPAAPGMAPPQPPTNLRIVATQ